MILALEGVRISAAASHFTYYISISTLLLFFFLLSLSLLRLRNTCIPIPYSRTHGCQSFIVIHAFTYKGVKVALYLWLLLMMVVSHIGTVSQIARPGHDTFFTLGQAYTIFPLFAFFFFWCEWIWRRMGCISSPRKRMSQQFCMWTHEIQWWQIILFLLSRFINHVKHAAPILTWACCVRIGCDSEANDYRFSSVDFLRTAPGFCINESVYLVAWYGSHSNWDNWLFYLFFGGIRDKLAIIF